MKRALASIFFVVLANYACKPPEAAENRRTTPTPAPEQAVAGASVFYALDGRVHRADCGEATPPAPAEIAARCQNRPGAGEAPTLAAFEAALTAKYASRLGDDEPNDLEKRTIHLLVTGLPGADQPDAGHLTSGSPSDGAASPRPAGLVAELIEARAAALLDAALDGSSANVAAAPADGAAGLALADGGPVELARGSLGAARVPVGTMTFSVKLSATAKPVDTLSVRVEAAAGKVCPLALRGVSRVLSLRDGVEVDIPVVQDPSRPGTFGINAGNAVRPTKASVRVRRRSATPADGDCLIIVEGRSTSAAQPAKDSPRDTKMKALMATRSHRVWHFLWHGIRGAWPSMSAAERKQVKDKLGAEWTRDARETESHPLADKGEEFLHMHRGMLAAVKGVLGAEMYEAWKEPPPPGSQEFPLPNGNSRASDDEYSQRILPLHRQAIDPQFLRSRTLGDYGLWLESGPHNALHMRFADDRKAGLESVTDFFQAPRPEWDTPNADYLGSTYSSHVNPLFYRLHGYVDARIDDWLAANGYNRVAERCAGAPRCYPWKRIWDGRAPNHAGMGLALADQADHAAHNGADRERFDGLPRSLQRLIQESSTLVFQPE